MRVAVIIAPTPSSEAVIPCAADGVRARGSLEVAGSTVRVLSPAEDLAAQLESLLATFRLGPDDSLIVYAAALLMIAGDGEALLCLDPYDPQTGDSLSELALVCSERATCPALFVLELRHLPSASDPFAAVSVTRAARDAVAGAGVSLAVAARPLDNANEPTTSPLTEELAKAIESVDPARGLSFQEFQDQLEDSEALLGRVPSYAHIRGERTATIVAPRGGEAAARDAVVAAPTEPAAAPEPAAKEPFASMAGVALAPEPPHATLPIPAPTPSAPRAGAAELVASAELHLEAGQLEAALSDFKKALILAKSTDATLRTAIYVGVGAVYLRQDRARDAIPSFEKALGLSPDHPRAREALLDSSVMLKDWRAVALAEDKLLASTNDPSHVLELLIASGTRWLNSAGDTQRARARFDAARELAPTNRVVLQRLCEIYERTHSVKEALEVRRELARTSPDPRERAEQYYALGEHQRLELLREDEAIELYDSALQSDPTYLEPLAVIARLLAERQEWGKLEAAYHAAIARSESLPASPSKAALLAELWRRLGQLFQDHLEDPVAALSAVESAIANEPTDAATRALAADLALSIDAIDRQAEHLQALIAIDPLGAAPYHELFEALEHLGRHGLAARVAAAIVFLGAAEARERAAAERVAKGPASPSTPLPPDAWSLLAPSTGGLVDAVFGAIAPAAIAARAAALAEQKAALVLDPTKRQTATESTVSAVRSLAWAAHFLGLELPAVYLGDGDFAFASALAAEPAVVVGGRALRGRSLGELAFLAGRHLAYEHGSARLSLYFPTLEDLSVCFVAALAVVRSDIVFPSHLASAATPLRAELERRISSPAREALARAVEALDRSGAPADLGAWLGDLERRSTRAGYLLAADLRTAATLLQSDPEGSPAGDGKISDLLVFSASSAHESLLTRLGL